MREQKGITLIALIITIIVMLILVGVTVNVAINGGLIDVTKEAKFKTEVRQIQEALQEKKVILTVTNGGELPTTVSIILDDLDMEQKLKDTFGTKLTIDKNEDDLILSYTSNTTPQEQQWLRDLGINGLLTFKSKVESKVPQVSKLNDCINYSDLIERIQREESDVICFGIARTNNSFVISTKAEIDYECKRYEGYKQILEIAEQANYSESYKITVENVENETINEIKRIASEHNITGSVVGRTISQIRTVYETNIAFLEYQDLCVIHEEEQLIIDKLGTVDNHETYIIAMSEQEASDFVFEEVATSSVAATAVAISSYKGTGDENGNVEVPGVIYDAQGNISKVVIQINTNAFAKPTLIPLPMVFDMTNEEYLNEATVADIYEQISGGETYTGSDADSTDVNAKNALLFNALGEFGLEEEDLVIENDGIPYIYFDMEEEVPLKKPATIKSITLPATIETIQDNAFAGRVLLEKVNYYKPIFAPTIASNAFAGCESLLEIRFLNDEWPIFDEPISGYETCWGAPNTNVKIYDKDGEI